MWKRWSVVIVIFCICQIVSAQSNPSDFEIGVHGGTSVYQGDLTPSPFGSFKTVDFEGGAHANIIATFAFSVRANIVFGSLRGDDAEYNDKPWRRQRNFRFSSSYKEIALMLVWNIFNKNY